MDPEIIETERLLLKGFSPEDMKFLFEKCSKQEVKKILGHRSEEDYLKEELKHKNGYSSYNRRFILFLLEEKLSQTIVGRCGIHNWNEEHRRAEIGYTMEDENYKRQGIMTEALSAVIEYGFTRIKLHRIEALVGAGNTASLRLMEKFHFIREGLLREHYLSDGKYEDSIIFSKLEKEFTSERKNFIS